MTRVKAHSACSADSNSWFQTFANREWIIFSLIVAEMKGGELAYACKTQGYFATWYGLYGCPHCGKSRISVMRTIPHMLCAYSQSKVFLEICVLSGRSTPCWIEPSHSKRPFSKPANATISLFTVDITNRGCSHSDVAGRWCLIVSALVLYVEWSFFEWEQTNLW